MKCSLPLLQVLVVAFAAGQLCAQVAPARPTTPETATGVRAAAPAATGRKDNPPELEWDAATKDYDAKPGETSAVFVFHGTNRSNLDVSITALQSSCGCTVAELPPLPRAPLVLPPSASAAIKVTLDLSGKVGTVDKSIVVESSAGFSALRVRAHVPRPPGHVLEGREANAQLALADRQAVFKGDCVRCHADNGAGKFGKDLYLADCAVCHNAPHRAAAVPDLRVPRSQRDLSFWRTWIIEGKPGTMMPAFGAAHGGPLSPEQVDSLVKYLHENFPRDVAAAPVAPEK